LGGLPRNRNIIFASFLEEDVYKSRWSLGARPQTPWVGFAEFWAVNRFREAEQRFLLLFLEKEDVYKSRYSLGRLRRVLGSPVFPRSGTTLFASFSGKRRVSVDGFSIE
jgi:hypothetical protein